VRLSIGRFPLLVLMAGLPAGCKPQPPVGPTVEIVSHATAQLLPDSLEVTPRIEAAQDMPEPGLIAVSLNLHLRNRRAAASIPLPRIGFRSWRDDAERTSSKLEWHRPARDVRGRTGVDSLIPGGTFSYGLSTSPRLVGPSADDEGAYRIEAYLVDTAGTERTVYIGHVRVRVNSSQHTRPSRPNGS
jgi:hypothetical protein